jgi:putative flippase GtrA
VARYLGGLTFSERFSQATRVRSGTRGSLGFVIRDFYARFKGMIHEVTKFGVVGISAFVITLAITNALHSGAKMSPVMSTTIATVIATIFAFVGNRNWAFKHRRGEKLGREGVLFLVFNGIGLLIQVGVVSIAQHGFGEHGTLALNVALIAGVGIATVFRLYCYHRWVFNTAPAEPPAAEQLEPETTGR